MVVPNDLTEILLTTEFQTQYAEHKVQSVLDLGCGNTLALAMIYHNHHPPKLVGIDQWEEWQILSCNETKPASYGSLYDFYKHNLTPDGNETRIAHAAEYRELLGLRLGYSLEEFLRNCREEYDLVICYDVLHYFQNRVAVQAALDGINRVLSSNGLFLIRVIESPGEEGTVWPVPYDYDFEAYERLAAEALGQRTGFVKVSCAPHNGKRVWLLHNLSM